MQQNNTSTEHKTKFLIWNLDDVVVLRTKNVAEILNEAVNESVRKTIFYKLNTFLWQIMNFWERPKKTGSEVQDGIQFKHSKVRISKK